MSFGIIAAAGIGLVGASMASDAQGDATDASVGMSKDQLNFDKQRYDDWNEIYGPLQEDIGTYYKNLTGKTLVGKELEAIQSAGQDANKQITQTLAQRGISGSGLEAELINDNTYKTEMMKSEARSTADQRAQEQKMKFLSLGLGQGQGIANSMSNNSANASSAILNGGAAQSAIISGATDNMSGLVGYASRTNGYSGNDDGILY